MKIDQEYLKGLLEAFESSEKPTTDIYELEKCGFNYGEDKFLFHLEILNDKDLIGGSQKNGLGYTRTLDGTPIWGAIPLRLTAKGHDFIEALQNKEVWETIKIFLRVIPRKNYLHCLSYGKEPISKPGWASQNLGQM